MAQSAPISMTKDKQYTVHGLCFESYAAARLCKAFEPEQIKQLQQLTPPISTITLYLQFGEYLPEHQ